MQRFFTTLVALALFAPAPALACGMYIPPSEKITLADVLEEIDAPKAEAKAEAKVTPTLASTKQERADANRRADVDAPTS
jgi:predicted small lipoprotein YifL